MNLRNSISVLSSVRPLIGSLALCLIVMFAGCGLCNNEIVSEIKSPSGKYKIVVFERDCGATTGFSTQVSLLRSFEGEPWGGGNVFISDDDHGAVPVGEKGTMDVRVQWGSDSALKILHPRKACIFKQESKVSGIAIYYATLD
jgi:hypothetical protein